MSGGLDPSAIVILAAQLAGDHRPHAFTARFPGFDRDEWAYAAEVARVAGVSCHHPVEPTAAELLEDLPAVIRDHEEPVRSSSVYAQWRVNRSAREAGVTVLLDGQGAEELLGGYRHLWRPAVRSLPLREAVAAVACDRSLAATFAYSLAYDHVPGLATRGYRRLAASPYVRSEGDAPARLRTAERNGSGSPLERALLRDSFELTLPALLRYADRSTMAHSREVRLPFLDRRVAEFFLSVPPHLIYRPGRPKWLLRAAMSGLVPVSIVSDATRSGSRRRSAAGSTSPRSSKHLREVLLDPGARIGALLRPDAVERDSRAGRWRDHDGIWRALNAELWLPELARAG